jgi:hypothetical protein
MPIEAIATQELFFRAGVTSPPIGANFFSGLA